MKPNALSLTTLLCLTALTRAADPPAPNAMPKMDDTTFTIWLNQWQDSIPFAEQDMLPQTIPNASGEMLGWYTRPLLEAYTNGYLLTQNMKYVDKSFKLADALIERAVTEPDGHLGWPSKNTFDTQVDDLHLLDTDSMLADAMILRPIVQLSKEILANPKLAEKYGKKAESYIKLAEKFYEKWDKRGAWRDVKVNGKPAVIPVFLPIGDDRTAWVDFDKRNDPGKGVSMPNFKANQIARWMLVMADATKKPVYKERAEKWFILFKSRLIANEDLTLKLWDAWQPAGPWDYKPDGTPKENVAPQPRPGYYEEDLIAVVEAAAQNIVFNNDTLQQLAASALAWQKDPPPAPLKAWPAYWHPLVPYNAELQKKFEAEFPVKEWVGMSITPRYLILQKKAHPDLPNPVKPD